MDDLTSCTCGHAHEEHGHDPLYPGSTACQVSGCGCIAFEQAEPDEGELVDA